MDLQSADPRTALATKRTGFAKYRTELAMDRTTLAWIRTALAMATFGFGTVGFFRSLRQATQTPEAIALHKSAMHFGVALIVLGVVATVMSAVAHSASLRRLRRDEAARLSRWSLSVTLALLLGVLGLVALWGVVGPS